MAEGFNNNNVVNRRLDEGTMNVAELAAKMFTLEFEGMVPLLAGDRNCWHVLVYWALRNHRNLKSPALNLLQSSSLFSSLQREGDNDIFGLKNFINTLYKRCVEKIPSLEVEVVLLRLEKFTVVAEELASMSEADWVAAHNENLEAGQRVDAITADQKAAVLQRLKQTRFRDRYQKIDYTYISVSAAQEGQLMTYFAPLFRFGCALTALAKGTTTVLAFGTELSMVCFLRFLSVLKEISSSVRPFLLQSNGELKVEPFNKETWFEMIPPQRRRTWGDAIADRISTARGPDFVGVKYAKTITANGEFPDIVDLTGTYMEPSGETKNKAGGNLQESSQQGSQQRYNQQNHQQGHHHHHHHHHHHSPNRSPYNQHSGSYYAQNQGYPSHNNHHHHYNHHNHHNHPNGFQQHYHQGRGGFATPPSSPGRGGGFGSPSSGGGRGRGFGGVGRGGGGPGDGSAPRQHRTDYIPDHVFNYMRANPGKLCPKCLDAAGKRFLYSRYPDEFQVIELLEHTEAKCRRFTPNGDVVAGVAGNAEE